MSQEIAIQNPTVVQIRLDRQNHPRLRELPYQQAIADLVEVINTAFTYSGRVTSDQDNAYIAASLYQELMLDEMGLGMQNITIAEIGRCVKRSVLGQGKEMYGISIASLYNIIADYCKGEGHMACKEIERMTQEQRMKELKGSAVNALIDNYANQLVKSSR